jgi:hypothetical protein
MREYLLPGQKKERAKQSDRRDPNSGDVWEAHRTPSTTKTPRIGARPKAAVAARCRCRQHGRRMRHTAHQNEAESSRSSEMSSSPARLADAPHRAPERGRKRPQQRDVAVASVAGGCVIPRTRTRPKAAAAARCRRRQRGWRMRRTTHQNEAESGRSSEMSPSPA